MEGKELAEFLSGIGGGASVSAILMTLLWFTWKRLDSQRAEQNKIVDGRIEYLETQVRECNEDRKTIRSEYKADIANVRKELEGMAEKMLGVITENTHSNSQVVNALRGFRCQAEEKGGKTA